MTHVLASRLRIVSVLAFLATLAACASSGSGASAGSRSWSELARDRTTPLAGAPRVAIEEFTLVPEPAWGPSLPLDPGHALLELVGAGLLRRADVNWVERRRFGAAAERVRRREPAPEGAPPVGRSPGVRWVFSGTVLTTSDSTVFNLQLVDAETSRVVHGWRSGAAGSPGPVELARRLSVELRRGLGEVEAPPRWSPTGGEGVLAPEIPPEAVVAFARGIAAEERYDWAAARAAYETALSGAGAGFVEAEEALARAARLRQGSPLGGG